MNQKSWAVTVERDGEQIVTLSSNSLAGRDLNAADERTVQTAAYHLLAFIGETNNLRAVAQSLVDFQAFYEANTYDRAPGNAFYAGKLMAIVQAAQSALTSLPAPAPVAASPQVSDAKDERDRQPRYSQYDLDAATKPLHAEIERLRAASLPSPAQEPEP